VEADREVSGLASRVWGTRFADVFEQLFMERETRSRLVLLIRTADRMIS
jgi:hypothetical protein